MEMPSAPEAEFVFHLVQRIGNPDEADRRLQEIAEADPKWSAILELVARHRLHSVLWRTLKDVALDAPDEFIRKLQRDRRENSIKNLQSSQQLYELAELFESNDVAALPYKGPVLAEVAYGEVGDRSFGDLDFLVAKEDIITACDLLERHGYERLNFTGVPVETLADGTVFRWGEEFRFIDSNDGLPVELRFGFIGGSRPNSEIFADFWERRTPTQLTGRTVTALSPEDRALLLLVHGTKHGWRQLSWVYDIGLCLQQEIDWETVLARANSYRWRAAVLYGLAVITELTGLSVPVSVRDALASPGLSSWGARNTVSRLRRAPDANLEYLEPITTALFLNDTLRGSVVDGIDEVLAPRRADFNWMPLPPKLHSLYYVVRPFHLVITTLKRIVGR